MNSVQFLKRCLVFAENQLLDLKYCGHFMGITVKTKYSDLGATDSGYTPYRVLNHIFKDKISERDVFVDVGCAKGRIIAWLLSRGFNNKIIGVELDEDLAQIAQKIFEKKENVKIVNGNILECFPEEGTIFYLFNPFDKNVMTQFSTILKSRNQPDIQVFYYNCQHIDVFENDSFWDVNFIDSHFRNTQTAWIKTKSSVDYNFIPESIPESNYLH